MTITSMKSTTHRAMTEDEFMRLPKDGRRWKLVGGKAREVPAGHEHDILVINIGAMLEPFARAV